MASTSQQALVHFLRHYIEIHGSSICNDQRKLYAVLIAEFPQRPAALVVLHAAVCSGIAKDVSQHGGELPQLLADRYAQRFVQHAGVAQDWAAWAVESWAELLGTEVEEQERVLCGPAPHRKRRFPPISRPIRSVDVVGHRRKITDLQFSPNGRWLVSSSIDRSIRVWDPRDGRLKATLLGGHRDWVRRISYHPSGASLCSAGDDGGIRLWNMKTGSRQHRNIGHRDWALSLAHSPDGAIVATGGRDGMIVLWHADSLDPLERIGPFMGAIHELAFDSTGQWLIVALPRLVELWSLQSRTRAQRWPCYVERPSILALPDGDLVIGDRNLRRVSLPDRERELVFSGHREPVSALALDPDSPSLVSASFDRSVRVWDVRDGRLRWTFELPRVPECCTVSRGGSIALTFGTKKAVIWEMERAV